MSKITDIRFGSRQEATFAEIMDRIQFQNDDMGAIFLEATGMQGVAKTAVILSFLEDTILNNPDQKCFWRNPYNAPFQFIKLQRHQWEIMVEEGSRVTFHDRDNRNAQINLPYKTFTDFDDLYEKATPAKCVAVFFEDDARWFDFIKFLNSVGEWNHLFLDEYGELFPAQPSGELYKMISEASRTLKEIRKCRTNIFATTQVTSDVDYRIRNKLMAFAYMYGSRPVKSSRVTQRAIDNLDRDIVRGNEGWLEYGFGQFGKGRFSKIYKPRKGMNWEAHRPEDGHEITDYLRIKGSPGVPPKQMGRPKSRVPVPPKI